MPCASVACASGLSAPEAHRRATKRRAIERRVSTRWSGTAAAAPDRRGSRQVADHRGAAGPRRRYVASWPSIAASAYGWASSVPGPTPIGWLWPSAWVARATAARTRAARRPCGSGRSPGRRAPAAPAAHRRGRGGRRSRGRAGARPRRPDQHGAVGKTRSARAGVEADDLEQAASAVAGQGADPHPGEDLAQAALDRGDEVRGGRLRGEVLVAARARDLGGELQREPRMDGGRARRDAASRWRGRRARPWPRRRCRSGRGGRRASSTPWAMPVASSVGTGSRSAPSARRR